MNAILATLALLAADGDLRPARHDTVRGRIEVEWKREGGRIVLDVAIPPNTAATVAVPGSGERRVEPGRHRFLSGE